MELNSEHRSELMASFESTLKEIKDISKDIGFLPKGANSARLDIKLFLARQKINIIRQSIFDNSIDY